jgi:glutaminase
MAGDPTFLMELPLFKDFTSGDLTEMQSVLEDLEAEVGHLLFKEGAWAASMFLVVSGAIEIFKPTGDKEIVFATLTSGACLGEMALVRDMYRSGSARAKVKSHLLVLKKDRLEKLSGTSPQLACRLYKNISAVLADRIESLNRELARTRDAAQADQNKGLLSRLFGG